jgi:DNA-binding CsgD family transcriptional regulator
MELVPRLGSGIPLVGRAAEMRRLRAALASATSGTAAAVLVSGDAGVGKSRLFAELAGPAGQQGALVLSGRCLDVGETGLPYLPFVEALIELRRHDPDLVAARPALARLLPGASLPALAEPVPDGLPPGRPGLQVERDLGQLQLFDALVDLLTELAERQCVVLVVEDLHWADSSTRDLLSFLLSRLRGQRLLVLASYRADDLHRRHPLRPLLAELFRLPAVERVELGPFDAAETRRFVLALAEEPVDDMVIDLIAERSEGNAFFAEELMAAVADSGEGMPGGLADVLLARIERLSPAAQDLVGLVSVAGRRVRHDRLQGVAQQEGLDIDEPLREAVQHNVLVVDEPTESYAFRHALLYEAVYHELLPGERVRLHAKYAKYLAAGPRTRGVAAALAHHSGESNDLRTALVASVEAAREAERVGAPAEALRHTERALQVWNAVPAEDCPAEVAGEFELLRSASFQAAASGHPERAVAYAMAAVRKLTDEVEPEQAAHTYRRLAQALTGVEGTRAQTAQAIERAWQLVRDRPAGQHRAWVLAVRAQILRRDDPVEARAAAEAAIEDSRAVGVVGPEADALVTLGLLENLDGRPDAAVDRLNEAVGKSSDSHAITTELRARYCLSMHLHDHGRLTEGARAAADGVKRAKETGANWSSYGLELRVMDAICRYTVGDWDGSALASEPPMRRVSDVIVARIAATGLFVLVGRGHFADADRVIAEAWPLRRNEVEVARHVGYAAAELSLWRGDPATTAQWVAATRAELARDDFPWMLGQVRLAAWGVAAQAELARKARRTRDSEAEAAAVADADELLDLARKVIEHSRPWSGTLGPEARGWLAMAEAERTRLDGPGDVAAWQAAVDEFGYGHHYQQSIARLRYAEALLGNDNRAEATEQLAQAAKVAEHLSAAPLSAALSELAKRGRLTVPGVIEPRDHVDPFTPRERAVLTLVAAGRTNRQVGEELYISEKTVSVHLSRIMTKLGANRRAEAVATAYERGLLESSTQD